MHSALIVSVSVTSPFAVRQESEKEGERERERQTNDNNNKSNHAKMRANMISKRWKPTESDTCGDPNRDSPTQNYDHTPSKES